MHRSRLGGVIIDCRTDNLDAAADFWSAALGLDRRVSDAPEDEGYVLLANGPGGLDVEVQQVTHDSRVHIDIETDDVAAEARRLEALGAKRVLAQHDWIVMEAPTGQRFCVVPASSATFAADANVWL